jgi:hypothetical protein
LISIVERTAPIATMLSPFRDAWLAGRARLAILASGVDAAAVMVEAYHGRVQLSGNVTTSAARGEAERAVRGLTGVVGVSNCIHVLRSAHDPRACLAPMPRSAPRLLTR